MVGGTITEAERRTWNRLLKVGFVLLVAGSAMLVALAGGATPPEIALIGAMSLLFAVILLRYLLWAGDRSRGGDVRR